MMRLASRVRAPSCARSISLFDSFSSPKWKDMYPPFHDLNNLHFEQITHLDPISLYHNNMYWIPRFYVQQRLSSRFLAELEKLKAVRSWEKIDGVALTHLCLVEATRDTTYDMGFNHTVDKPTRACPLHGTIDILIYNSIKEDKYLPIIPVMFPQTKFDKDKAISYDHFAMAPPIFAARWGLYHSARTGRPADYVRAIQTNGLAWRFFEVHESYVKKTTLFYSMRLSENNVMDTKKLVENTLGDLKHWRAIVGMVRYTLGIAENVPAVTSIGEVKRIEGSSSFGDRAQRLIESKFRTDLFDVKAIEGIVRSGKLLEGKEGEEVKRITAGGDKNGKGKTSGGRTRCR